MVASALSTCTRRTGCCRRGDSTAAPCLHIAIDAALAAHPAQRCDVAAGAKDLVGFVRLTY
jgi:hypothetical protein